MTHKLHGSHVLRDLLLNQCPNNIYLSEIELQYIFYYDETPGLSCKSRTLAHASTDTTDGAAIPGNEHSPAVTVMLTINMLGVVLIPHIIVANSQW